MRKDDVWLKKKQYSYACKQGTIKTKIIIISPSLEVN